MKRPANGATHSDASDSDSSDDALGPMPADASSLNQQENHQSEDVESTSLKIDAKLDDGNSTLAPNCPSTKPTKAAASKKRRVVAIPSGTIKIAD